MTLKDSVVPFVAAACLAAMPAATPAAMPAAAPAAMPAAAPAAMPAAAPAVVAAGTPAAGTAGSAAPGAEVGPQEMMNDVAKRMFEALDANRAAIHKDSEKVFPLVDQILLPHFDTDYAAQLVLGQHSNAASPAQRKRFVNALYGALLRTYGAAISDFTADRLKILPYRGDAPGAATAIATVHTLVTRSSGRVVPVDYRMHKTATGWKAFDVVIEGISYVRNYRTDLGEEISQKGIDEVIERLEKETLDLKTAAAAKAEHGR